MSLSWRACLAASLALAMVAPAVSAQSADAPELSADVKTVYAHVKDDGVAMFMNSLAADGLDAVSGPTGPANGYGALANSAYTWSMPLEPGLTRGLALDAAGKIEVTLYMGAGTGTGRIDVSMVLLLDGTAIATGPAQALTITPASYPTSGPYNKLTWSLAPTVTTIPADGELTWEVTAKGTASNAYLGSTELRGRSNLVLPIIGVIGPPSGGGQPGPPEFIDGQTFFENVTESSFARNFEFAAPTTQLNFYNWTAAPASAKLVFTTVITEGTAAVAVLDLNYTILFEGAVTATSPTLAANLTGVAGIWIVAVLHQDFSGSSSLTIEPPAATNTTQSATATKGTSSSSASASNTTTSDSSEESTPMAPWLLVVALAVAVAVVRRRLA